MAYFQISDIEPEVFADLLEELQALYEQCEINLIELESFPNDVELHRSLFRAVHTIKGDLGLLAISPLVEFLGYLEDCLGLLREGKIEFNILLSDLLLLSLERVNQYIQACHAKGGFHYEPNVLDKISQLCHEITPENASEHKKIIRSAVLILDPSLALPEQDLASQTPLQTSFFTDQNPKITFFRALIQTVEANSPYWQGKSERQLKLALLINRFGSDPVDEAQLATACYLHDFGMGFVPLDIVHKAQKLTLEEQQTLKTHVYCSAKLLENLPEWQTAKMMILQHHERPDGSGYPLGLKEFEINDGAKILAIVDTFEAMTHERASTAHLRRPFKRAIAEVNRLAGTQLSAPWVAAFNQAMAHILP